VDIATSKRGLLGLKAFFGLLVVFLYAPLVLLVIFSFNDSNIPAFPLRGFTTHGYEQFWANTELRGALATSAKVGVIASLGSVGLSLLASIALVRRNFFAKSAVSAFLLSPLVIPLAVFAIALLILFSQLGLATGMWTLVAGHIVISLPYTILVLMPRLQRIDVRLEEAARDLGAGAFRTFRSITLPLITPAIVSAFLVAFVFSFDEIVLASFVAGNTVTFPLYLFSQLRFPTLLPQVIAVAVVVMVASAVVVLLAEVGRRIVERRLDAEAAASALEVLGPIRVQPAEG